MITSTWQPGRPVDLVRTLSPLRRGGGDPTHRVADGAFFRCVHTPDGPATLALSMTPSGEVLARAWGPGAEHAVAGVPDLLGARDDVSGFAPEHPLLRDTWRRHPGMRVPRTGVVWDSLLAAVLEQKVTGKEAHRSWRELVWRFGTPAPGPAPAGMRIAPDADTLSRLPSWEWHRAGVDGKRSRAIRAAASVASRLEEAVDLPPDAALARLRVVPGIGQWTAAEIAQRAFGNADAVSVGDYHIPSLVGWALIGTDLDDDGMLELLEEYRPHRHRVVRLIEIGGRHTVPPRRAPRITIHNFRRM